MFLVVSLFLIYGCSKNDASIADSENWEAIFRQFEGRINPNDLNDYNSPSKPAYIVKDNHAGLTINNKLATLGRVLFYDKNLSINNAVSCAGCHNQKFAFGDTSLISIGVLDGQTSRHSMRLVNARFAQESRFFWDERAQVLALQTTQPIKDHAEMGFSGQLGRPDFYALISKIKDIDYYNELFTMVYNDSIISEIRIQEALTHFILSIQSFDSKYDLGRQLVPNDAVPFPNFSQQENQGKQLFLAAPVFNGNGMRTGGGAGCQGCHRAPEFDIDPNSRNNGVTGTFNGLQDFSVTRSPSLRDLFNQSGQINGPFMHNGVFSNLRSVINHYNQIPDINLNLDPKLSPNGHPQLLNLTEAEKDNLVAFLKTLSGDDIYTNLKWSDPFK